MTGKENREIKNSVFVDLFYEDESAEANEIALFNAIHDVFHIAYISIMQRYILFSKFRV